MNISKINFTTTKIQMFVAGKEAGTASGFFFRHKGIKYLATNRHVIIDEDDNFFPDHLRITLHLDRKNLEMNISIPIDLYEEDKPLWRQHPLYESNHCDVILLPLETKTIKPVNPFSDVVVIGYPLGFYDEKSNLPVYRRASIASAYGVNFRGLPYFLIDDNLHPGTSGSPVVNSHHTLFKEHSGDEGYTLFGVHSAEHVIAGNPLGLNVVWYADALVEIAES